MSSKDEPALLRRPLRLLIILIVCACSMAVHFVAEELGPVAGIPGSNLTAQSGDAHLFQDNCEDNFVFPLQIGQPFENVVAHVESMGVTRAFSYSIPPLLPPPIS